MANVKATWVLPTTREDGTALPVEAIAFVDIELGVDGENFASIGNYTPDVLETIVQDLEVGTWYFRGAVVDTQNRRGAASVGEIVIPSDAAPGALLELNLSLV